MSAKDDLKILDNLIANNNVRAGASATYKNKSYTLAQLIAERDKISNQLKQQGTSKAREKQATQQLTSSEREALQKESRTISAARGQVETALGNLNIAITRNGDVAAAQKVLSAAYQSLRAVNPQDKLLEGITLSAPSSTTQNRATAQMRGEGVGSTTPTPPAATQTAATPPATTRPAATQPSQTATVSAQSVTSATDQKTFVDSELTKRKLKNTPANREKLRKEFQTKNKPADDMAWMDEFKKTYAAYSDWTTNEVIDHFGQDFVDILKEAVNTEFTDEEIQARIKGTQYFKSITDSQYKFDGASSAVQNGLVEAARNAIVKDYADVGLAQTDIDEIAKKVARNGLTTTGVKQAVYQYAFRKPAAATTPTAPGMARNAIEGGDADAIRIAARAYGYNVSDAEMQAALTGGMYNGVAVTQDSILQKAQKSAKGKYFHLADQIDAGLSLEDIFSSYRNYAADALEIDPNQIDFTKDSKWARAFGTKETGQMSLTDWVTTIKSDPSFGWQFTKQANQQATDIGLTLARAFGKVG
jgi:hypothetical protein